MPQPQLIAWAPTSDPQLLQIGSVLVHPNQKLDRGLYLALLSSRVQRLVNNCQNKQEAVDALVEQMSDDSLLEDPGSVPWETAGDSLVLSNPPLEHQLRELGLLENLKAAQLQEMPEARQVLDEDRKNPASRLLDWASALASH